MLALYMTVMLGFAGQLWLLNSAAVQENESAEYVRSVGFGDMAFYSDVRAVRFYSLSSMQESALGALLGNRSVADFIYRAKR